MPGLLPGPNLPPIDCVAGPSLPRSEAQTGEVPVAREQRKLAAILAGDVVGYSGLMGRDESGTVSALKARRSLRLLARMQ
jgi:class 3 adenylate cyclase